MRLMESGEERRADPLGVDLRQWPGSWRNKLPSISPSKESERCPSA
jgi:hypothetical protein